LQDDLMRRFYKDWVTNAMKRMGMEEGVPIESGMVSRAIARAQKKVEDYHFEIRKNLLEYDEVMDSQRKEIYTARQQVLENRGLKDMVSVMLEGAVIRASQRTFFEDAEGLRGWWHRMFGVELDATLAQDMTRKGANPVELVTRVNELYTAREAVLGAEAMRLAERYILLNTIDSRWKDHLRAIDALRQGIGLRSYAQVDPKNEYKREGFLLFDKLKQAIEDEIAGLVLRIEIRREEPAARAPGPNALPPGPNLGTGLASMRPGAPPPREDSAPAPASGSPTERPAAAAPAPAQTAAPRTAPPQAPAAQPAARPAPRRAPMQVPVTHAFDMHRRQQAAIAAQQRAAEAASSGGSSQAADGGPSPQAAAGTAAPRNTTPRAAGAVPEAGRNDPCPCGSGQKYKKCHGKES
jgi:preprotein translocase subunit SecA